ncbi:S-adenosyl-L-methionine-dependent methyltransferase [Gautieria morchelliformis]|nr:S-adenosyl-L-methionine-dependent methyltransferase [Gautieria morchelliformis]
MNQSQEPSGSERDHEQLDGTHEAIKFYLGGRLSLAPLEKSTSPMSILDMGCGSGAWAVQAAEQFPDADMLAVDLSMMPSRPLPPNLRFQILDLAKPFPFESQSFDIVHARFVFLHLPKFEEVLNRTMQLVKPGGWLLLDDIETTFRDEPEFRDGPGHDVAKKIIKEFQERRNINPRSASAVQGIIESSGLFSEVNVRKIVVPISRDQDPHLETGILPVVELYRKMIGRAIPALMENVPGMNQNSDGLGAAQENPDDLRRHIQMEIYMTWSRKQE